MHAFLIHGGTKEIRKNHCETMVKTWGTALVDTVFLSKQDDANSIGITEVRTFQKQLILTPYKSSHIAAIITEGELLTKEAQNALLKTIEEPPPKVKLILLTDQLESLLPTIISRCQCLTTPTTLLTEERKNELITILSESKKKTPGQIIQYVDTTFLSKEDGIRFIHDLLIMLSEIHSQDFERFLPSFSYTILIREGLQAKKRLTANTHYNLTLDAFFSSLH